MRTNPLERDLEHVIAQTRDLWDLLAGKRVFITGGTGFFGCWLLESLLWANDKLGLGASALVLTRNPEAFQKKAPHLASHPAIRLQLGDVRSFEFPPGSFSYVIHAATEASAKLNSQDPLQMFDTIVEGTRRTLDFARYCSAEGFLFTSSGAVYGRQPPEMSHVPEDYSGAPSPTDPSSAYGEAKRAAELLCTIHTGQYGLPIKIARCFAFVGPYLPLDIHYAIGNFIGDALRGGPIRVKGNGTPYRSYLYAADLAIWLWTILLKGKPCYPYNVGSEEAVTIGAVARTVAEACRPPAKVEILQRPRAGAPAESYVPATQRSQLELGLKQLIDLGEGVERSLHWHRQRQGGSSQ